MDPEHYIQDLDEMIKATQEKRASMLDACHKEGAGWTRETEKYWEGAFSMVTDLLNDLNTMRTWWGRGEPAYHATEKAIENK